MEEVLPAVSYHRHSGEKEDDAFIIHVSVSVSVSVFSIAYIHKRKRTYDQPYVCIMSFESTDMSYACVRMLIPHWRSLSLSLSLCVCVYRMVIPLVR